MKYLLLSLSFLSLSIKSDWKMYEFPEDGFQVLLPMKPQIKKQDLDSDIGKIKISSYVSTDKSGSAENIYIVNHTEYPGDFSFDSGDSTGYYVVNTLQEGLLAQLDGKMIYSSPEEIAGKTANVCLIMYSDSQIVKNVLITTGRHLYSLQLFTNYKNRLSKDAERYFKSFQFLENETKVKKKKKKRFLFF